MEVSSSYAQALFSMVLSLRQQAVPFEVGKPLEAHVAAVAVQERINSSATAGALHVSSCSPW